MGKKKNKSNKNMLSNIKLIYVLYAVILLVFVANMVFEIKAEVQSGNETFACGDYGCDCSNCECGEIQEVDTDADNETNTTTATENATTSACSDDRTATSSTSGELWTYSFSVRSCNGTTASVYLKGSATAAATPGSAVSATASGGTLYLYQSHAVSESGSLTGGGVRAVSDGYGQICINMDGTENCG